VPLSRVVTLLCKLTFPDGPEVTGEVHASSPAVEYPIVYTGAVERLPMQYQRGTPSDLELTFTVAARRSGAKLTVERSGCYESRA
jgi:hypothetical protein